jgi:hypothetical protein
MTPFISASPMALPVPFPSLEDPAAVMPAHPIADPSAPEDVPSPAPIPIPVGFDPRGDYSVTVLCLNLTCESPTYHHRMHVTTYDWVTGHFAGTGEQVDHPPLHPWTIEGTWTPAAFTANVSYVDMSYVIILAGPSTRDPQVIATFRDDQTNMGTWQATRF